MATTPRLPDYVGAPQQTPQQQPQQTARGARTPASAINKMAADRAARIFSGSAEGEFVAIAYGRCNIEGKLFARGTIGTDEVYGFLFCAGEIDAVEMVQINDVDASTITGVTVTAYTGTPTQGVDPTLAAAVPAYNDTMRYDEGNGLRGIVYVVVRMTSDAAVTGWPRVRATLRGRKVYDPRTGLTAYSDNSALCMGDLIASQDYGLGLEVLNLAAAADWCDSLLADGVTKRARLALVLDEPAPILPDWLDTLSVYAECYYVFQGAAIKLIPDQPVDLETTPRITSWVAGSLSLRHEDTSDSPTEVQVTYTEPRSDAAPWQTASVTRKLADNRQTKTSISLEGVWQAAEADNKALMRLHRARSRISVSVTVMDSGVQYQAGDVVRLISAARGLAEFPVRVTSVSLSAPGRHQLSGYVYSADQYPGELPVGIGNWPDGVITMWGGGAIPDGWSAFAAANGRYIRGAGGAHAIGDVGGDSNTGPWSGTTSSSGAHSGSGGAFSVAEAGSTLSGPGYTGSGGSVGAHAHGWSAPAQIMSLLRRSYPLVKRSGIVSAMPAGMLLFGLPGITHPSLARVTSLAGRLVMADTSVADAGAATQSLAITVDSANMRHGHAAASNKYNQDFAPYADIIAGTLATERDYWHTHSATLVLAAAAKRKRLALYTGAGDFPSVPGLIALSDAAVPPTGWLLCDGTSGTPDMRGFLAEIAAVGNEGTSAGDDTVSASATSAKYSHSHGGSDVPNGPVPTSVGHGSSELHDHTISASQSFAPPWYALNFIMFSPGA